MAIIHLFLWLTPFSVGRNEAESAGRSRQTHTGHIASNVEESSRFVGVRAGATIAWSENQ